MSHQASILIKVYLAAKKDKNCKWVGFQKTVYPKTDKIKSFVVGST